MAIGRRVPASLVITMILLLPACGNMGLPDDRPRISIEFGMYDDLFEGNEVLIDGKVVGKLEKTGKATRISFPVTKGRHEVRIDNPQLPCEPRRVVVELTGQKVRLLADIEERADASGRIATVIVLR